MQYKQAITFGRFNIPHSGHVDLIHGMLCRSEQVIVFVSDGKLNNDWDLRVLMLRHMCRTAGIDLTRVKFEKSTNPFDAVESVAAPSTLLMLGTDQQKMARKLADTFNCDAVLNPRINSSTQVRFFLDQEQFIEDLNHLYDRDEYATALAMILRKEERSREKSHQVAA